MTRRARRLLFVIAILIFLFVGYIAALYAQGYKYSLSDGRFVRTGAIYIKSNVDARMYIDDKFAGATSFLGNTSSKSGLLPRQYTVRVARDGYTSWQKKVIVQEGFVSYFQNVLIVSENEDEISKIIAEIDSSLFSTPIPLPSISLSKSPAPKTAKTPFPSVTPSQEKPYYIKNKVLYQVISDETEIIAKNVSGFILDDDESRIVWWNGNNELWVMWLKDINYQPGHKQGDVELITRFSTRIKNIAWFRGNDHVVVDSLGYKIVELDTRGGINIIKL